MTVFTQPTSATGAGLSASLHNFDIDDATVKPEHCQWLDANIVPPLTDSLHAGVALRGTASKSGAAEHDLALSQQRVDAVADYLVSQGVQKAQIATTFTGKNLSVSTLKEDEADRAVFVLLASGQSSSAGARFTHVNPLNRADGLDVGGPRKHASAASSPLIAFMLPLPSLNVGAPPRQHFETPRLLVVQGQRNEVRIVTGVESGPTAKVSVDLRDPTPANRAIAQLLDKNFRLTTRPVQYDPQDDVQFIVRIQGGIQIGEVLISARDESGQEVAHLRVINVAPITKSVSFTYVKTPSGLATTRNPGDEKAMLEHVNKIYNRQTGISFTPVVRQNFTLKHPDFATATEVKLNANGVNVGTDWVKIFPAERDHTADFNIIFLKNIKCLTRGNPTGISTIVENSSQFRDTIFRDSIPGKGLISNTDAQTLVHELGHDLGERHNTDPESIMCDDGILKLTGFTINVSMALRMRENLDKFTQK